MFSLRMDQKLWLNRQNMQKTNMLVKTSLNSEKKKSENERPTNGMSKHSFIGLTWVLKPSNLPGDGSPVK